MGITIDIPSKSYNTRFGNVSKCVWFSVTDNYNLFQIDFRVVREQRYNVTLQLSNYDSGFASLWTKTYPYSSNTTPVLDSLKFSHVPGFNSVNYAVLNV